MCLGCLPVWRLARHVFNTLAEARQAIAAAWIQAPEGDESTVNGGGTVRVVGNMDADDIGFEVSQFIEILCLDKVRWA